MHKQFLKDRFDLGNFAFIILLLILPLIQLSKVLRFSLLESELFLSTFVLLLICVILYFLSNPRISKSFLLCLLIIFFVLLAVLLPGQGFNLDYFKKAIIFISTVLIILFVTQYSLDNLVEQIIYFISLIQSIVFIIAFYAGHTYPYGAISSITFGFANPNFTGMWLLNLICVNFIYIYKTASDKKYFGLFFALVLTAFDIYFLFLTDNRSSLLGLILLFIGILINLIRRKVFYIHPAFVACMPFIVVLIYYIFIYTGWINLFSAFSDVGKELTSRVDIWNEAFRIIFEKPLFGQYNLLKTGQLHNMYIDIVATYGLLTFFAFVYFLYRALKSITLKIKTQKQNIAYWGFCAVMVTSCFEAALVSGSTGLYIMSFALMFLTLKEQKKEVNMIKTYEVKDKLLRLNNESQY